MSAREAAAFAASRGLAVFPLRPQGKRPAVKGWEQVASRDPAFVAGAWPPQATGYGIACGPSGLVVLDADVPKDGEPSPPEPGMVDGNDTFAVLACEAGQPLPVETLTVSTPSRGWHWYFRAPVNGAPLRNSVRQVGWCLDVRAGGGYVVGPGSEVGGKPYSVVHHADPEPLPGWLTALLRPAEAAGRPSPAHPAPETDGRAAKYAYAILRGEVAAVLAAQPGSRNDTLNRAAHTIARKCGGAFDSAAVEAALIEAARTIGLAEGEARATVRSGLSAGAGR